MTQDFDEQFCPGISFGLSLLLSSWALQTFCSIFFTGITRDANELDMHETTGFAAKKRSFGSIKLLLQNELDGDCVFDVVFFLKRRCGGPLVRLCYFSNIRLFIHQVFKNTNVKVCCCVKTLKNKVGAKKKFERHLLVLVLCFRVFLSYV